VLFGVTSFLLQAQGVSQQYLNYIERYKGMAIDQMLRYKIPASITLAQGLLESGAGTSTLARKANNHFGIKCGRAWKGPYVLQDDDERNEKFRKYRSVEESYEDHSRFLQQARYSSLFDLSPKDYKGWARGLKRCGYATNPRYASLLIDLIERYDLDQYDKYKSSKLHFDYSSIDRQLNSESLPSHLVYRNNENYYIIARLICWRKKPVCRHATSGSSMNCRKGIESRPAMYCIWNGSGKRPPRNTRMCLTW